jgi:ATP-dependent Clp protease ATP-binding subunit ClpA
MPARTVMMMFELFNEAARKVLLHASQEASALGHQEITPEHLVLGVMKEVDGIAAIALAEHGVKRRQLADAITDTGTADPEILRTIGVDLQSVRRQAEANFGPGALDRPRRTGLFRSLPKGGAMPYTNAATKALEKSLQEAQALTASSIGTEHILLGLLADEQDPAPRTLRQLGADPTALRESLLGKIDRSD